MRSLLAAVLAIVVGTLVVPLADANAAPSVSRFSDGLDPGARPWELAAGPDGNVWFTDRAGPRIGRISPDGAITTFSGGLGGVGKLEDIAAGPDGALWFTDSHHTGLIGRISTAGAVSTFTAGLPNDRHPTGITSGPDGNLWFTLNKNPGGIGRITPAGTITVFTAGLTNDKKPRQIASGPDGNLWFTTEKGIVGRITTAGVITEFTAGLPTDAKLNGIAAGPDGNLWFALEKDPGHVGRITTAGVITLFNGSLTPNSKPAQIAAGSDGAMWFTLSKAPGRLGRITTAGVITEHTDGLAGPDAPYGIVTGSDNRVWFALSQAGGALAHLGEASSPPPPPPPPPESPGAPGGPTTAAPEIDAVSVASLGETGVKLSATVSPNGAETRLHVEYGPDDRLGSLTSARTIAAARPSERVEARIDALAPGNDYRFRMVAENAAGTTRTKILAFTTDGVRVPGAPPFAPILGKNVVLAPASGTIRVRLRGSARFVDLTASAGRLPVGSVVDARSGRLRLSSGVPGRGGFQTATLWDGAFQVRQGPRGEGVTEFRLVGAGRATCTSAKRAKARTRGYAEQARGRRRRASRRGLWARDRKGKFRTRGRNSVATVRGTKWLTVDRCDGTLPRVVEGTVVVRDLHRKRGILVRAGESYLAPKVASRAARR